MNLETQKMQPLEIKIAMLRANVSQKEIAEDLKISQAAVSLTIKGTSKSERIRQRIAKAIGKPITEIWT